MSVPAGLMQALQGASGASAPTGPGPAAGSGPMPPSITIPPSDGPSDGGDSSQGDGDGEQDLHEALDALHAFLQDDQDHVDKQNVAKCVAIVQGILATRQKGHESALGITPAMKAMSRTYKR